MSASKLQRHRALRALIDGGRISSQAALAEHLRERGFVVTQATVSRDLEEIGAIKVRHGESSAYALPEATMARNPWASDRISAIVGEWVRSVATAGTMVVLKTPPGSAHLVGFALDQADLDEIVGTLCGDDTIFIATRSAEEAGRTAEMLRSLAAG